MEHDDVTIEDCLILYDYSFAVVLRAGAIYCIKDESKNGGMP